ncbi:MAG: hypothetical protein AAGB10_14370 [Pseudomonadota bacterium]
MPIYVEARNIEDFYGLIGGHMYLLWIPTDAENDIDRWRTIGVFPEIEGPFGPWGLIVADRTGGPGEAGDFREARDSYLEDPIFEGQNQETYQPTPQELEQMAEKRGRQPKDIWKVPLLGR